MTRADVMTELPTSIAFAEVERALGSLGISLTNVLRVDFGIDAVEVEAVRCDANGRYLAAGDNLATVTTVIGYDR